MNTISFFLKNKKNGRLGIWTLDPLSRIHVFETCAFNHSANLPFINNSKYWFFPKKNQEKYLKIFLFDILFDNIVIFYF